MPSGVAPLNLLEVGRLDFEPPDLERFPCLRLARQAMEAGGTATAVLNAGNEVAVDSFLNGSLRFSDIPAVVADTLASVPSAGADSLEAILATDAAARAHAARVVSARRQ